MRAWGRPPVLSSIHSKQAGPAQNILGALPIITGPETPAEAAPSLSGDPFTGPKLPRRGPVRGSWSHSVSASDATCHRLRGHSNGCATAKGTTRGKNRAAGNDALGGLTSGKATQDKGDSPQERAAVRFTTALGKNPSLHSLIFTYLQIC